MFIHFSVYVNTIQKNSVISNLIFTLLTPVKRILLPVLHWGQHQDVLSNGCATAWTVYSISCVCRSKQNQTSFCLVAWGRRLLYVYFSRLKFFFFFSVVLH